MTKITLTWQRDNQHKSSYTEEILLTESEQTLKTSIEDKVQSIIDTDTSNQFKLDNVTRAAAALTIENCTDQLFIVKALVNEPKHESCFELLHYRTLRERFALTPKEQRRQHEEGYEKIPYTDCQKLRDDVCFICATLGASCKEIFETGCFTNLLRVIFATQQQDEDTKQLEATTRQKRIQLKNLKKLFNKEKKEYEEELLKAMEAIAKWKNTEEDMIAYGKSEIRYLESWEGTRHYQNDIILTGKEDEFNDIIQGNKTKVELENRIHNEIENFISENTEDLQDGIQYWMHHYDEEVERRDSETYQLKMKWEALSEDHIKLQETYEEHRIEIEEWITLRETRRIQTSAAIRLQAWWRGTMVRNQLGPFRPPPKKKGKKGDKKGKGKGKKKN